MKEGVPFANGAPNLTRRLPGHARSSARETQSPDRRQGLQDRSDLHEDASSRPASRRACSASTGWFSTNILGNRDGEVLDDPGSFKSKEV